jgi:hypothetical protein
MQRTSSHVEIDVALLAEVYLAAKSPTISNEPSDEVLDKINLRGKLAIHLC